MPPPPGASASRSPAPGHREGADYFDCYPVLGVPRDAEQDVIQRAHRRLVDTFHPDKLGKYGLSEDERQLAIAVAQEINAARDELRDEGRRRQLDDAIRRAAAAGAATTSAARDEHRRRREQQEARRPGWDAAEVPGRRA